MNKPARRISILSAILAALVLGGAGVSGWTSAWAQSLYNQPRYAALVVDAASGEVLYARRADQPRYPASITKVMTLYLVFEALQTGKLSLTETVPISRHAANQPPSKLGLRPGDSLTVDQAIRVVTTKSANDIATALAEKVGGSEARFSALMTLRAQELGMTNTRFVNASGLPDTRQISTARDIAILSRAMLRDYPQYYHYFGQTSTTFRGQTINGHNNILKTMPGADGIKTGYTNASGFNLAASAVQDGKRLIAVVLGGNSTAARDDNVEELLRAGFDVMSKRKSGELITIAANMREPDDVSGPVLRPVVEQGSGEQDGLKVVVSDPDLRGAQPASAEQTGVTLAALQELARPPAVTPVSAPMPAAQTRPEAAAAPAPRPQAAASAPAKPKAPSADAGAYRIQVGAFSNQRDARRQLSKITSKYAELVSAAEPLVESGGKAYRARFVGFSQTAARQACKTLSAKGEACLVLAPG